MIIRKKENYFKAGSKIHVAIRTTFVSGLFSLLASSINVYYSPCTWRYFCCFIYSHSIRCNIFIQQYIKFRYMCIACEAKINLSQHFCHNIFFATWTVLTVFRGNSKLFLAFWCSRCGLTSASKYTEKEKKMAIQIVSLDGASSPA